MTDSLLLECLREGWDTYFPGDEADKDTIPGPEEGRGIGVAREQQGRTVGFGGKRQGAGSGE